MYHQGQKGSQYFIEAMVWYERASDFANTTSMNNMEPFTIKVKVFLKIILRLLYGMKKHSRSAQTIYKLIYK